jgi:prefoldin alpha subunit
MEDEQVLLQEKLMRVEQLKNQAEAATQQMEIVVKTLMEMSTTKEALLEIAKLPEGTETLVPLGSGVYVQARVTNTRRAFMGLGAETVVEKDFSDCVKILEEQILKVEEAHGKLSETVGEINETLKVLVPELESAFSKEGRE